MEPANTKDFQWKSLAPLPSRRVYCTLVEAGGQVFAIGGCDDNGVPVDSFEVYSPEADQWTSLPPMPTARAGVAVTTLGKRIMVVGGVGVNQMPLKVVEMYNVDEGKWKKRSSLREAAMGISMTAKGKGAPARTTCGVGRVGISCLVKDYRVYAAGGMGSDLRPHNFLQHYDMLKDIWVSLAAMPTPRYAATSFLRGTKIYVLGGRQSKYAVNAFEVFDTDTRAWTKFPNIPNKRAFSSFVPTEDRLFSLGGLRQGRLYRQPKFMRTVDMFDMEQGGWMKMERSCYLKKRRADFVAGYLRGRVVVAGGLGEKLGMVGALKASCGSCVVIAKLLVLTGNQPTVLESAEAFHPEKSKWESLPPMPTPRCACSSIVVRDCLLAVGGVSQGLSTAVEALCLLDS
ncbi:Kelch domain-containing protein 8A [Willisornis vidua]|uniref:Kelch domain-containing protein 8A n=1 Tax=Willisornis vidua TaxID=1566151 RepID=A0ABQ9CKF6_9PASS|nr:Kelch domain-containing protein 8A [Willisornis vidua]